MEVILNSCEVRVLGCLIEKELATPEYYPLTLNALTNACNQKSNRDPVMTLQEADVASALDALRFKQLAVVSAEGGRAVKYRHILAEKLRLSPAELALLAELLVRGPQTIGELRTRAERMHAFPDPAAVEDAIEELMARTPPLVMRLSRQPGRKEQRLAHLFSGEPESEPGVMGAPSEAAHSGAGPESKRIGQLEADVVALRAEVEELHRRLKEFMEQFG
jgi:uncharacterized protein YceH (UPF0502 family)